MDPNHFLSFLEFSICFPNVGHWILIHCWNTISSTIKSQKHFENYPRIWNLENDGTYVYRVFELSGFRFRKAIWGFWNFATLDFENLKLWDFERLNSWNFEILNFGNLAFLYLKRLNFWNFGMLIIAYTYNV